VVPDPNAPLLDQVLDQAAPPPPEVAPAPPLAEPKRKPRLEHPLLIALLVTITVTALSYLAPTNHAATVVGLAFLVWTRQLVLREDEHVIRAHGLSLGGLLEPLPLEARRLATSTGKALLWAFAFGAVVFPVFWFGFKLFWHVNMPFAWKGPKSWVDEMAGQLLVVALPEEAFFRGYLQTRLDGLWPPKARFFGADLGMGLFVASAIFAVGHLLTTPTPARLAVFFPALLFGFLRTRTRGIGAGVLFHAMCNIFSATLMRGYGLSP